MSRPTLPETQDKQQANTQPVERREPRKKLPAEIKFDKAAYGGISYLAQALTGIALLHSIKYGKLKEPFKRFSSWITRKPAKEASTTLVITTMIMVGNAFLLPVKWLENRKPKIVRWIQERMNAKHPPTPEERAGQEKALEQLEREPKQTWKSLIGGRVFGLAPVFAVNYLLGEGRNTWLQDKSAYYIQKGFGAVGLKKMGRSRTVGEYLKLGFVDSFYSAVAAGGLYIYSHFINPPEKNIAPRKPDAPSETAATPDDVPAEPASEKQFTARHLPKSADGWQAGVAKPDAETSGLSPAV